MHIPSVRGSLMAALLGAALAACSSESTGPGASAGSLVVYGAGSAADLAPAPFAGQAVPEGAEWGPAGSVLLHVYALWISSKADCSDPILVQQHPAEGVDKEFMQNPVLFEGNPPAGAYQCVVLKMSDVLRMQPATSFGSCVAGTEYRGDIYREGEADWKDVDLQPIIGSGTDEAPVNDHVAIFMTVNPAAAMARGISENQIAELTAGLVVPGRNTFVMDASQGVLSYQGSCGLEKPVVSFR